MLFNTAFKEVLLDVKLLKGAAGGMSDHYLVASKHKFKDENK